jgi:lysozyme
MKTNAAGVALIKRFESCKLEAYLCPAGVWTIGWGHTGASAKQGTKITQHMADIIFEHDLTQYERDVTSLTEGVALNENEFSALVSFAYNCGSDIDEDDIPEGLGDSRLLKKLCAGDRLGAANEFLKWNKSKGRVLAGLVARRAEERLLFLTPMKEKHHG